MLVYSRHDDVTQTTDPLTGETYTPDETGAFDVPTPLAEVLIRQHIAGERAWETSPERQGRLEVEADARRRDPLALLDAVEKLQARPTETIPETPDERVARAALLRAEADLLDPPKRRRRTS